MEKTNGSPFICVISPVGAKMEVFVLAGRARLELAAGPVWPGPDRAGLMLLTTGIVRSPGSVCREPVVTPTATARRQHSRRQGEERCLLVYFHSVSEMPHVLKTLPSVQGRLFDSRALQFLCRTQGRLRAGEVSWSGSCFQTTKVDDLIRCKWSVEW